MAQCGCGDDAGANNVKIAVQSNPRADDGVGGQNNAEADWSTKFESWAIMKFSGGGEPFTNRNTETRRIYKFTMDFPLSSTVLSTDRILFGSRKFNVRSVDNVNEQNMTLIVRAEEGVSD